MILIFILVIILIPRNTRSVHSSKSNHGQGFPHRKTQVETDDSELPFPGIWSMINIFMKAKPGKQNVSSIPIIASVHRYNTYKPAIPD